MFQRLKTWVVAWADRCQQREIQRLREEGRRLKEEVINLNGGEAIPLSPEQRRLLAESRPLPPCTSRPPVFEKTFGRTNLPFSYFRYDAAAVPLSVV